MKYKVEPFIAQIGSNGSSYDVANQVESFIRTQSSNGWEFVSCGNIDTEISGSNGCFGIGATPSSSKSIMVLVFQQTQDDSDFNNYPEHEDITMHSEDEYGDFILYQTNQGDIYIKHSGNNFKIGDYAYNYFKRPLINDRLTIKNGPIITIESGRISKIE